MRIHVRLGGRQQVIATVRRMAADAEREFRSAVSEGALEITNGAKELCPVDTGRLRSSIRPSFYEDGLAAEIGTDVEYAPFVEYGTGRAGASSVPAGFAPDDYRHGSSKGQPARPFLFPAWDAVRHWVVARMLKALNRVVGAAR